MNTTTTTWPGPDVIQSAIERPTAMRLAQTEYQRVTDAVEALRPEDWTRPTDCTEWDVRQLVAHIAGQANLFSSPFEAGAPNARGQSQATARQGPGRRADRAPGRGATAPRARGTARRVASRRPARSQGTPPIPGFLRRRRLPGTEVVNGVPEAWSLGYVTDVILTRDAWMHRLDLARATGQDPVLTADHDGVIVADIVAEWARRHGQPYQLELTGPAGGSWSSGTGGEEIVMDAADFCRVLTGRPGPDGGQPWGLLTTQVPF